MRLVPALALATVALAACRDREATSPDAAARTVASRSVHGGNAQASIVVPAPNGFTSTALARGTFTDAVTATFRLKEGHETTVADVYHPSDMVMSRITLDPGGALPWHTHPGPALVAVAEGELTLVDSKGCEVRHYAKGTSFMDEGQGHVHVGLNVGDVQTVVYVTFFSVTGPSPLLPAENPGC